MRLPRDVSGGTGWDCRDACDLDRSIRHGIPMGTPKAAAPLETSFVTREAGARKTPHPDPLPRRDLCVTRGWLPERPLTEFGRGRPILPLPQGEGEERSRRRGRGLLCKGPSRRD